MIDNTGSPETTLQGGALRRQAEAAPGLGQLTVYSAGRVAAPSP
jgi:hypothetical protein